MAPAAIIDSATEAAHSAIQTTASALAGRPRILVPEKVSAEGLALLREHYDVDTCTGLSPEELISIIPSYHGLIVRSETKVTADVLAAGSSKLRVVARAGVGVDNIDVNAATQHGIIVVNSPSGNIVAAAEHTVALLLASARNVGRADSSLKSGKWERSKLVGVEVGHKTLGIIGLGKVGMKVARMAIGLGMKVVALDPYASPEMAKQAGVSLVENHKLEELLPVVDFLTIHTPLLASTLNLLGEKEFQMMKKTARVLNVARGGVYNEEALLKALDGGWIAGAGIDVFTSEPPEENSMAARLAAHPKVVSTPHLGASTVEAQENVSMDVCTQVLEILRGGLPTAAVNAPLILPEEYRRLQPFVKLVEKMGSLYTQHFARSPHPPHHRHSSMLGGRRFELVYTGELANISNTRPLYAALVKGLVSPISDASGGNVNMVNATLIARERGIAIDEKHVRDHSPSTATYASQVTLRSVSESEHNNNPSSNAAQVIEGYVSGRSVFISKLDRFSANFHPEGTLLVLHNYDQPGKIGNVGMVLGRHSINITFMQVASLDDEAEQTQTQTQTQKQTQTPVVDGPVQPEGQKAAKEALMILGVDGDVTRDVIDDLAKAEGILDVSLVRL
ncbi:D-isomer specific 2-hydroxyacid dehydrogenase [Diplogelasinospora grovesii]|uniref:D-3-phosphoglycerate dehydrogenase n=1 Tax=Diplogelasinospora grovesii TaxID=303347 RepID=A0AAN6S947_9PEZI|nr:D-isomer specific 2-hydroxyacid dehydrogenase [Diplogelasinospora grovesii]